MALSLALSSLGGCVVSGADGGPHPEPPIELGPPGSQADGGLVGHPDNEGEAGRSGAGGVSGSGGAAGPAGGGGEGARGEHPPPLCGEDAGVDASWEDEDSGALR